MFHLNATTIESRTSKKKYIWVTWFAYFLYSNLSVYFSAWMLSLSMVFSTCDPVLEQCLFLIFQFVCIFQCLDAKFEYGFEYMGSSPREVITPFTERCLLSLTQAIKANMASLCIGPPVSISMEEVYLVTVMMFMMIS